MTDSPGFNDRELVQTRVLAAPPDTVFSVWTTPEHLAHWWGPRGFTTTTHAIDLRPGGHWRFTMHGPDGRDYENRIEYLQVEAPHLLVYRHTGDVDVEPVAFHVTVSFARLGANTLLTLRSVFDSPEDLRRTEEQYGACQGSIETLTRLAEHLATPDTPPDWHYGRPDDTPWLEVQGAQRLQILVDAADTKLIVSEVPAGFAGPFHVHEGIECIYVLEGSVVSQGVTLEAGQALVAEAGTRHEEFRSERGARFLVVMHNPPGIPR